VYVDVAALTHRGKVRQNNEDQFLVGRTERDLEVLLTSLDQDHIPRHSRETGYGMIVADGMGGEEGGEVASRLAIKTLVELVIQTPDWLMRLDDELAEKLIRRTKDRYRKVDAAIRDEAQSNPSLARMGTTLTVAVSLGADLFVIHVGDSRAYLLRNGQLRQLTRDQTVVQALLDAGVLTHQEAATHKMRHVLTQALGQQAGQLKIEVQRLKLEDGDCLLLCTDGLTEMVPTLRFRPYLPTQAKPISTVRPCWIRRWTPGARTTLPSWSHITRCPPTRQPVEAEGVRSSEVPELSPDSP
jgi:protein phosphatase